MARKSINIQSSGGVGLIVKGPTDSSFGQQPAEQAVAPKAVSNSLGRVTPIEAWTLSAEVHTAVQARNFQYQQVQIRLFTKGGEEITAGPAVEFWAKPNPTQTGSSLLQAVSYWSDISGERAAYVRYVNARRTAHALNPMSMAFQNPVMPKFPEDILVWRYIWDNGTLQNIPASDIVRDIDWNPSSLCRSQSPLYTVVNDVDGVYRAVRYLRSFFTNGSRPSNIINVDTDNPDEVAPFKQQYLAAMQGEANAWHSFFTYGKKVTVENLDAPLPDGPNNPIQMMIKNVRDKVAALYMVPPLHAGMWDQTKFDSVEQQNDFFYESVFLPRLDTIQRWAQMVTDQQMRFAAAGGRKRPKLTGRMRGQLEKAIAESEGDIVIVLDADHIPAVSALKRKKIEYAQSLQRTFHITPEEAATEVGLDIELSEASKLVWYETDQKFIEQSTSKKADALTMAPAVPVDPNANDPNAASEPSADPKKLKALKNFFMGLRKLSLSRSNSGARWTLAEADTLAREHDVYCPAICNASRIAHARLTPLQRKKDEQGIKAWCNDAASVPQLRLMAKSMTVESDEPVSDEEKKRRKEFLLLLLAFFAWQAEALAAGTLASPLSPASTAKLTALLSSQMGQAATASLSAGHVGVPPSGVAPAGGAAPLPALVPGSAEWDAARGLISQSVPPVAAKVAEELNATTAKNVETGIKNGLSRLDAIEAALKKAVVNRATLIEDDMNHVAQQMAIAAWLQVDHEEWVQWETERDEKVCDICGPLDGLRAHPGQEFRPGIRWPTIDTHGNCRCRLIEVPR